MTQNLSLEMDFVRSKSLNARYSFHRATRLLAVNVDVLVPGSADDKGGTLVHKAVKEVFGLDRFDDVSNTFELTLDERLEPKRWLMAMLDGVEIWLETKSLADKFD